MSESRLRREEHGRLIAWVSSPLATEYELVALEWLKDLCDLPPTCRGVFTTGAGMGNFVGVAAAGARNSGRDATAKKSVPSRLEGLFQ